MAHRDSVLSRAMRLLMVPLIVASPAMCCCWFGPAHAGRASAPAATAAGEPGKDCCEPPPSDSDGCRDGGACGEDQQSGCACPKAVASPADGGTTPVLVMPAILVAWEQVFALPEARAGAPARWSLLARPPPIEARQRVLRL